MTPIVLFGLARSVYTRIARLALEEKGVPYLLEEVEIFGPSGVPPEHIHRHPFGRIPVLKHGDFELYETTSITRYIDETFSGVRLQPTDVQKRARMNQIIGAVDSYAYRPMVWGVFVQRVSLPMAGAPTNQATVDRSLHAAGRCLAALEALSDEGPFLVGADISLADVHLFPVLRCFTLVPEGEEMLKLRSKLKQWFDRMMQRPSVQRTCSILEDAEARGVQRD